MKPLLFFFNPFKSFYSLNSLKYISHYSSGLYTFNKKQNYSTTTKDLLISATQDQREINKLLEKINTRKDWNALFIELKNLQDQLKQEDLWEKNVNQAIQLQIQSSKLKDVLEEYDTMRQKCQEMSELVGMLYGYILSSVFFQKKIVELKLK
jgi:hypothetical protein